MYIYVFSVPLYMVIENKDDWLIDCILLIFFSIDSSEEMSLEKKLLLNIIYQ
jgi:hypothetical protein